MKTLVLLFPTQYVVVSATRRDGSFGCFDKGTAEVLISLLNIGGARRCYAMCGFIGKEAIVIPVSLAEVPSLYQLTQYWGYEFCSNDERWLMLRPMELLKHKSVQDPVVWLGTRKGQVRIGSSDCTVWIVEEH